MALNRTLVQIRERSFLELLDLALVLVRRRTRAIGLAAAAGIAPFAALYAFLASQEDVPGITLLALAFLASPWATAPLTVVLGGLMFGERPRAGRVARTLLRSLPLLFAYQGLLRAVLMAFVVLIPLIPSKLMFLNEVILLERGAGRRERSKESPYERCNRLSAHRSGDLFGNWLASLCFGGLFLLSFRWALGWLVELLAEDPTWDPTNLDDPAERLGEQLLALVDLRSWTTQLALWLVVAFFGVVRFLTYIDQRIRLEGWAVELRLRAAGAALEDAERW